MIASTIGATAGGGLGAVIGLAISLSILHSASLAFAIRLARGVGAAR
jgi:hypothetical protein